MALAEHPPAHAPEAPAPARPAAAPRLRHPAFDEIAAGPDSTPAANYILRELDMTFLDARMLAMPTRYYAAVSVVCDIVCPFCPRQYHGEMVDNGVMNFAAFQKIAPNLKFADFAGLYGLGEPFLHKDFLGFLEAAKRTGAFTTTSTHGMSLTDENIHHIIDQGLDDLSLSMDGATKPTFELLRAGAIFEEVCTKVRRLAELKRERGVTHPTLQIACTISRHNVHEMADLVALAKDLGAYQIVFSDLIIINPDNEDLSVWNTPMFEKNLAKARKAGKKLEFPVHYFHQKPFPWLKDQWPAEANGRHYGCFEAWKTFTVERRGDVKPCCYLEEYMGNAFETPADALRNSGEFVMLRRSLMDGRPNEFCQNCGNLREIDHHHVRGQLALARRMIDEAAPRLSPEERERVEKAYASYANRARAEWGADAAPTVL